MGLFEDLNSAGLRAIGLVPQWVDVAAAQYTGAPDSASDGVYLEDSPRALVYVAVREDVSLRTSRVVITSYDLTVTVYTVTIDGNAVVYDASVELPATNAALLEGIRDKINNDATVKLIVTADVDPDNTDTVRIKGDAEADYSINVTAVGGTGTLTFNADASTFDLRGYCTSGGIVKSGSVGNADRWVSPLDFYYTSNNYRGFMERFDVAGLDRLAVELENIAGHGSDGGSITLNVAGVMIGPTVIQS